MAKLTAASRKQLPASAFALPSQRKYPENDKTHARVAESYGSKEYAKGNLSLAQLSKIRSKAKGVLGK